MNSNYINIYNNLVNFSRNKKLFTMRENGINPFPHKFNYSHKSKEILSNLVSSGLTRLN